MKVLFIADGAKPDYQSDVVLHGLRSILGADVVDVNRATHMYAADNPPEVKATLYGRGFTLFGLLPDDAVVDRSDIGAKIRGGYFDAVVFGSIHRNQDYLSTVLQHVRPERIAFIDGEDEPHLFGLLLGRGLYFKRELWTPEPLARPISFGIPDEKVFRGIPNEDRTEMMRPVRSHMVATIDPQDRATYIYETEEAYYEGYRHSVFAYTMPKGGWDCMRHYEIISQGCIPLFRLIERMPPRVMTWLPKWELYEARCFAETHRSTLDPDWIPRLRERLAAVLPTTKSVARGVLDALRRDTAELWFS